jgi:hypothetical protein
MFPLSGAAGGTGARTEARRFVLAKTVKNPASFGESESESTNPTKAWFAACLNRKVQAG